MEEQVEVEEVQVVAVEVQEVEVEVHLLPRLSASSVHSFSPLSSTQARISASSWWEVGVEGR